MASPNISNFQSEANNLNSVAMMFIRCYAFTVTPFGIIGHSLSIYVFTRPKLRSNACARYFLAATIIGLLVTCYNMPMRVIQSGFVDTDPGAHSVIFCKTTWFLLSSFRGLCPWLIVLASVDRFLCSSASTNIRTWSSVRVANWMIPITIVLSLIAYIHVPVFFDVSILSGTRKPICYPLAPPGTYRIFLSFFNLFYFGLLPSCCMLVFGLFTFRNIERSKRRLVGPSMNTETTVHQNIRRTNRHMIRMLFFQVLVCCITGVASSVGMIVTSMNHNGPRNVFEVAQANVINGVIGILSNAGSSFSFYIFTLSSGLFRKELKKLFDICHGRNNQIQPTQAYNANMHRQRSNATRRV